MTRFDQAFIKVYTDQDEALPTPSDSLEPGASDDAPEGRPPGKTTETPVGVPTDGVLEMLQQTATRIGDLLPPEKTPRTPQGADDRPAAAEGAETAGAAEISTPAPMDTGSVPRGQDELEAAAASEERGRPATARRIDPAAPSGSTPWQAGGQPVRPPHVQLARAGVREVTAGAADAGASQNEAIGDQLSDGTFRPLLQVDCFTWPAVCSRLGEAAADELDRLADRLVEGIGRGEKVVAVGGCRRGEGATTLLLCAGRRLAERGFKVVMADANLADPQLACRLDLLAQSGWEDVLAGGLPLEEVVIESAGDRLAVLPVRQTSAGTHGATEDETRLAESIRTLAAHYDLVLLDPGPLEELSVVGASLARGIGSRLDAIALVHHGGVTPPEDLDEVRRWLTATEIVQVGVIENFVRD